MMPASHGWRRDVVLGGKNTSLRLESVTGGWAEVEVCDIVIYGGSL